MTGVGVTCASRRHMLIPKRARARPFVPVLPEADLAFAIGKLAPPERKALAQIVETADVLMVDGKPWLLLQADTRLLDTLAAFGAEAEDREPFMEDEIESDDDTTNDLELDDCDIEPDCPGARRVFAAGRMLQGAPQRQPWRARYDAYDNAEMRAAERFCRPSRRRRPVPTHT